MTPLTKVEKEKILSRLFWDIEMIQTDMEDLLEEKFQTIDEVQSQQFFSRLLTSCDWYTLLKLIPPVKLKMVLSDQILNRLYPKDLKNRYIYARNRLPKDTMFYSPQSKFKPSAPSAPRAKRAVKKIATDLHR